MKNRVKRNVHSVANEIALLLEIIPMTGLEVVALRILGTCIGAAFGTGFAVVVDALNDLNDDD